jgi:hypothetical protein
MIYRWTLRVMHDSLREARTYRLIVAFHPM